MAMHVLLDPLRYSFMQHAFIGTVAIGILCAVIGCFVVFLRLAFIGEGLAHGSLAGLAIGYILHWDLYLAANLYTIGLAILIGMLHEKAKVTLDTAIGILFSTSMALGIALISSMKFYTTDLTGYLFGSVLAITPFDLKIIIVAAILLIIVILLFYQEYVFYSFDPEMAEVAGLPRTWLHYSMLIMIAVTVVVAAQTVGIILVTALLIIPPASAQQWTHSLRRLIILAIFFSLTSAIIGLYISYYFNIASGASIAMLSAVFFFLSFLFAPRRQPLLKSFGLTK